MKKIIILFIIIGATYYIWGNMQPNQEVIDAKKQMGIQVSDTNGISDNIGEAKKEIFKAVDSAVDSIKEEVSQVVEEKITPTFSVEYLTDNKFIELDKLEESDLTDGEVRITGKTLKTVDSIRILYTNKTSDFPDDDFTLKKFKSGDATFSYGAFSRYETFDFGTNIYTFYAYSGDEVAKLELTIYYPNPENINKGNKEKITEGEKNKGIDTTILPTGAEYGNPIKMGEETITYSDIKGFELTSYYPKDLTCESNIITKIVQNKTSSWSWWNTCRTSEDKNYISFFALNIKDNKYTYAKHYYSKQFYATIELESGEYSDWDSLETIEVKNAWLKEKNNELKQENDNFKIIKITDNLFTEMNQ